MENHKTESTDDEISSDTSNAKIAVKEAPKYKTEICKNYS